MIVYIGGFMKRISFIVIFLFFNIAWSQKPKVLKSFPISMVDVRIKSVYVNDRSNNNGIISFVMDKNYTDHCEDNTDYNLNTAIIRDTTPSSDELNAMIFDAASKGKQIKEIGLKQVCGRPNPEVVFIKTEYVLNTPKYKMLYMAQNIYDKNQHVSIQALIVDDRLNFLFGYSNDNAIENGNGFSNLFKYKEINHLKLHNKELFIDKCLSSNISLPMKFSEFENTIKNITNLNGIQELHNQIKHGEDHYKACFNLN